MKTKLVIVGLFMFGTLSANADFACLGLIEKQVITHAQQQVLQRGSEVKEARVVLLHNYGCSGRTFETSTCSVVSRVSVRSSDDKNDYYQYLSTYSPSMKCSNKTVQSGLVETFYTQSTASHDQKSEDDSYMLKLTHCTPSFCPTVSK